MARSEKNLTAVFTDTASAIRAKTGTTEQICPLDFADKINAIETGGSGGGMKAYFENGGRCAYSISKSFDNLIHYSDTENITNFNNMFYSCTGLTAVPNINMTNASLSRSCFSYCSSIKTANITTPSTDMSSMFSYCTKLTDLTISNNSLNRVSCSYIASNTTALQTANLNVPMSYTFSNAFSYSGIKSANLGQLHKQNGGVLPGGIIDTFSIEYQYAFNKCSNLEEVTIDIGSTLEGKSTNIDLNRTFANIKAPEGRTTPLTITFLNADADVRRDFVYCFSSTDVIRSIPAVNCTKASGLDTAFKGCTNLEELKFYNITNNIDLSDCTKMTRDALVEVLNNLATVTETRTCTLGANNLSKLNDFDKAIATGKGWRLAL